MTHLLYQTDSYLKIFQASVVATDDANHAVTLDQTAFYPGGGGQPCDIGDLTGGDMCFKVVKVKKSGEQILHFIESDTELPPVGAALQGQISWERRFALMRTHTALHILCGVVFRDYGAQVTGGDMDPLNGRMDFEFETMQKELVREIETAIQLEVEAAHPVQG